jgi:hypothetical protein
MTGEYFGWLITNILAGMDVFTKQTTYENEPSQNCLL